LLLTSLVPIISRTIWGFAASSAASTTVEMPVRLAAVLLSMV